MKYIIINALLLAMLHAQAQDQPAFRRKSLPECIEAALHNNLSLQAAGLDVREAETMQGTAFDVEKTSISYTRDPLTPDLTDKKVTVSQSVEFPTVYVSRSKTLNQETLLAERARDITENEVIKDVSAAYYNLCHAEQLVGLLEWQDSIYADFVTKATLRVKVGETNRLELMNAQSLSQEIRLQIDQAKAVLTNCQLTMGKLLNTTEMLLPVESKPAKASDESILLAENPTGEGSQQSIAANPLIEYYEQQLKVKQSQATTEINRLLPDIFGGYYFTDTKKPGFEIGIRLPLFFGAQTARVKAAKIKQTRVELERRETERMLQNAYASQYGEYLLARRNLDYYEDKGVAQADEILRVAQTSYGLGEIGYMEYIRNLQSALEVKRKYFDALNRYNQSIITIIYLKGGI